MKYLSAMNRMAFTSLCLIMALVLTCDTVFASTLSDSERKAIQQDSVHYVLPTGSCSTTDVVITGDSNSAKAFNYFVSQGLQPHQAAGIIGNLLGESSLIPNRKQGSGMQTIKSASEITPGTGYGIAQWTSEGRQKAWLAFAAQKAADPLSLELQLQYLLHELETNAGYGYTELKAAGDVRQATWIFLAYFERPAAVVDAGLTENPNQPTSGSAKEALDAREQLATNASAGVDASDPTESSTESTPSCSDSDSIIATPYTNPVYNGEAPDPGVIRGDDGTYHVYATGNVHLTSKDLVSWKKDKNGWNLTGGKAECNWAPDVAQVGSKYILTWAGMPSCDSAGDVSSSSTIRYAVSDSAGGPFTYKGNLTSEGYAIDPHIFVDGDKTWLVFGGGIIRLVEIQQNGDKLKVVGQSKELYRRTGTPTIENGWIENRDGWYYLFFSQGHWNKSAGDPEYSTKVARSKTVDGPYEPTSDNYKTILSGDGGEFWGPGGASITTDDAGADWMIYHAWYKGQRVLMIDPVTYGGEWPTVNGTGKPSTEKKEQGPAIGGASGGEGEPDFNKDYNVRYDGPSGGCVGGQTVGAKSLSEVVLDRYSPPVTSVGGYACRSNTADSSELSIHAMGRALDIMVDGTTPKGLETGDKIRNYMINNAEKFGVQAVIWNKHIWTVNHKGWRDYSGPNPHTDHVHVEINIAASKNANLGK